MSHAPETDVSDPATTDLLQGILWALANARDRRLRVFQSNGACFRRNSVVSGLVRSREIIEANRFTFRPNNTKGERHRSRPHDRLRSGLHRGTGARIYSATECLSLLEDPATGADPRSCLLEWSPGHRPDGFTRAAPGSVEPPFSKARDAARRPPRGCLGAPHRSRGAARCRSQQSPAAEYPVRSPCAHPEAGGLPRR
jgi:hypothetical protein